MEARQRNDDVVRVRVGVNQTRLVRDHLAEPGAIHDRTQLFHKTTDFSHNHTQSLRVAFGESSYHHVHR